MKWDEAVRDLFSLERHGIKLELTRMIAALDALGRPQDRFACILVAGTNGKGSVAAEMASALSLPGRRVGLYTSPHLLDYRERIRIQGRMADPGLLLHCLERDRPIWERYELSFFEATTALALCAFREVGTEIAVLEVGLGGRLDATNTCEPILSVITSLGMDHAYLLGDTPAAIALEKAGIMRAGIPVALAGGEARARAALLRRADELGAPAYPRGACLVADKLSSRAEGVRLRLCRRAGSPAGFTWPKEGLRLDIPLPGVHQAVNAALAALSLALVREAGWPLADEEIGRGIGRVRWPGRLERPVPGQALLADVAHNREGARMLARYLSACAPGREIRPVVGMLAQKDHRGFFRELGRVAREAWIAPLRNPRAAGAEELRSAASAEGLTVRSFADLPAALRAAMRDAAEPAGALAVLCGSFHTLDEGYTALGVGPLESLWEEVSEAAA